MTHVYMLACTSYLLLDTRKNGWMMKEMDEILFSLYLSLSLSLFSLKSLDLVCMKELDHKVNIIPIIGKADTIARSELEDFKQRVCYQLLNIM